MMQHAWEARMDFIERIFGVSPDGGNGSLEFFCLVSLAVVVFFVGYELYFHRKHKSYSAEDFTPGLEAIHSLSDGGCSQ